MVIRKDIFSLKPAPVCDSHVLPLCEEMEMVEVEAQRRFDEEKASIRSLLITISAGQYVIRFVISEKNLPLLNKKYSVKTE